MIFSNYKMHIKHYTIFSLIVKLQNRIVRGNVMKIEKNISKGDIEIGNRVRKYRTIRKLTQRRLAELVMVSPSSITRLEKGQIMVSVFTMIEIAKVLDVSISYLLVGENNKDILDGTEFLIVYEKLEKCSIKQRYHLIRAFEQMIDAFLS